MQLNKGGRTLYPVEIGSGLEKKTFHLPEGYSRDPKNLKWIGKGAYGSVARTVGTTGSVNHEGQRITIEVAVKMLTAPLSNQTIAQRCYRELKLLLNLSHGNIARIVDVFTTARNAHELEDVTIVTKYAGSTLDILLKAQIEMYNSRSKIVYLPMANIPSVIRDTLNALSYLKSANVLHRDLKSANLAISNSGRATLIDYGLARIGGDKTSVLTNPVFTCNYRAIEVILGEYVDIRYGPEADIWSLGCILAEMVTWQPLFMSKDTKQEIQSRELIELQITRCGPIPDAYLNKIDSSKNPTLVGVKQFIKKKSAEVKKADLREYFSVNNKIAKLDDPKEATVLDFLSKCLKFDPSERITIEDAFKHPFIRDICTNQDSTDVVPLSDEVDCKRDLEEWKQIIFEEIQNFQAREDTPMP